MSLFGALYVGTSGLQTSQNALNTTAHNMSNLDTTGYTRQQVLQGTRSYYKIKVDYNAVSDQQIGLGVYYSKVRQVRDYFLDQTYRKEIGRYSFYETSTDTIWQIETIMGEMKGVLGEVSGLPFSEAYDDFWSAVQELSKNPAASVGQGLLVSKAYTLLERAQAVYNGLCDYQDNLNQQIKEQVDKINAYGKQISELNERIRRIEASGQEAANDLRDARNQLLDELAAMANISYTEVADGTVKVKLESVEFVQEGFVNEIGLKEDETTGFYTPFWKMLATYTLNGKGEKIYDITNAEVFNLERTISSDLNTDIGSLKALMHARGDRRADYTDMLDADTYNKEISQSLIMNVQAEFDKLIHEVATRVNEVIAEAAEAATAADPNSTYLRDSMGRPLQLFVKTATDGYELQGGVWVYVPENTTDPVRKDTLYTTQNLMINPELLLSPSKLDLIKPDDSEDFELGEALKAIFEENTFHLNPNVQTPTTLAEFYNNLVSQIANTGSIYETILVNQQNTVETTEFARQEVVGVSSDEELNNMIKFQNAYNASSRYINVIDEMLEHIINTLGT